MCSGKSKSKSIYQVSLGSVIRVRRLDGLQIRSLDSFSLGCCCCCCCCCPPFPCSTVKRLNWEQPRAEEGRWRHCRCRVRGRQCTKCRSNTVTPALSVRPSTGWTSNSTVKCPRSIDSSGLGRCCLLPRASPSPPPTFNNTGSQRQKQRRLATCSL